MRVSPKPFLEYCARNVPLLRLLGEETEWTEPALLETVKRCWEDGNEQPERTVKKLVELRIIVEPEPGSGIFEIAEPLRRLFDYIFDEAKPTTPEVIQGYIASLGNVSKRLERALAEEDVSTSTLALQEICETLRRIHRDSEETRNRILNEVALFKTSRRQFSVRDKYQRIVHWMERYVEPMGEIIRVDGEMEAAFAETGRVLRIAQNCVVTTEASVATNVRLLRLVERFALRVFQQCRRELQPLYESLRRASLIAEGAALALSRLQKDGTDGWVEACAPKLAVLRFQRAPSDDVIALALSRIKQGPPPSPPIVRRPVGGLEPEGKRRRKWLEEVFATVETEVPLTDTLGWLTSRYGERSTSDILAAFTRMFFSSRFRASFEKDSQRVYETADGELGAHPVALKRREK